MPENIRQSETVHASCVAVGPSAILLIGPSGSGKSAMALELMSRGANLIADDRTILAETEYGIRASCPVALRNQIEARGVGLLASESQPHAIVRIVVDLGKDEEDRLPPEREITLLGQQIPLLHTPVHTHFPAAILQYVKGGRTA